jgi:type 1 fimbria pilin
MRTLLITIVIIFFNTCVSAQDSINTGMRMSPLSEPNVNISGTIVASMPCKVNNDAVTDIEFNNVIVSSINGVNFTQNIPIEISCSPGFSSELDLTFQGMSSPLGSSVIVTSIDGLGINISKNGNPVEINKKFSIDWRAPFQLQATPVKENNSKIDGGEFSATANLLISLQ